ncbi:hypothetical protein ACWD4L_41545 [Streptomyces sp. NPDC002596]
MGAHAVMARRTAVSRPHVTPDRFAISAARHRFHTHIADHARRPELLTPTETFEQRWDGQNRRTHPHHQRWLQTWPYTDALEALAI